MGVDADSIEIGRTGGAAPVTINQLEFVRSMRTSELKRGWLAVINFLSFAAAG